MKEELAAANNKKVLDLEKEKTRLSLKVAQLQELAEKETVKCVDKEQELKAANSTISQLKEDMESLQQFHTCRIAEAEVHWKSPSLFHEPWILRIR
jgi:hypothetical protein